MVSSLEWIKSHVEHYWANVQTNTCKSINHIDEPHKLGKGFMLADPLNKVDIGDGSILWLMFIN